MSDVSRILRPHHFMREANKWCYEAMLGLWDRDLPIDQITVTQELQLMGRLADVGGPGYLSIMVERLPTTLHCIHYAELVRNTALQRTIIEIAGLIANKSWEGSPNEIEQIIQDCADIFNRIYEEYGEQPLRITDFVKTESDPPRYSMVVRGVPLECTIDELLDCKKFIRMVAMKADYMPQRMKDAEWCVMVNSLMSGMHKEIAPKEVSVENTVWEAAIEVLKGQPFVETVPEFMAGLPVLKDDFIFVQGTAFLNLWQQRVKQTRNLGVDIAVLWSILKRLGQARKQTVRIGKDVKEAWRLPSSILNGSEPDYDSIELW